MLKRLRRMQKEIDHLREEVDGLRRMQVQVHTHPVTLSSGESIAGGPTVGHIEVSGSAVTLVLQEK